MNRSLLMSTRPQRWSLIFMIAIGLAYPPCTHAQIITTVAGGGNKGDGGLATAATLYFPGGVAVDGLGNLYIADPGGNRIRKVNPTGIITTVAGTGTRGYSGDGESAIAATLDYPSAVAVDGPGNLYIADTRNNRIRKVGTNGIITTVAGTGAQGSSGDGGPATAAKLFNPSGVALDGLGNLYIADRYNRTVRKVSPIGIITRVAGGGEYAGDGDPATKALLNFPTGIAVDRLGNLYIADMYNHQIQKVTTNGIITRVAGVSEYGDGVSGYGGDGGPATKAHLNYPSAVAVDGPGNLYITDQYNSRIRKVSPTGIITTVAGTGTKGFSGDEGPATAATLNLPTGIAVDGSGNLYIADQSNHRIRRVVPALTTTPPVATTNISQTAMIGTSFSYTTNAFTDAQTPNGLTYSARIDPPNGLSFDPTTRVVSGTTTTSGVSSVTITATDPDYLSASTVFTITSTTACIGTPSPDYAALADLYNATGGPNWTRKTNWLSGCSPCGWYGVSCNGDGRVTSLSLHDNQLNGTIPASLSALSNLQSLYLYGNQLSGIVPPALSALTNLQALYLSNNQLSGTIPASLSALSRLTSLDLSTNQLSGPIPAGLGGLTKLQILILNHNQLSGCFPTSLSALCGGDRVVDFSNNPNLPGGGDFALFCANGSCSPAPVNTAPVTTANASQTALVGTAFSYTVNAFPDAETPNALTYSARIDPANGLNFNPTTRVIAGVPITGGVSSATVTATDPGGLSASTVFTITSTTACPGTPSPDYAALADLYNATGGPNWTYKSKWLTGCSPCSWYGIACNSEGRVTTISLHDNQLKGSLPASLSVLSNLQILAIFNNQLSGPIPDGLSKLTNLQRISLYNNQLSGCFPASLSALCGGNRVIDFSNNPNLPGGGDFGSFCANGTGRCYPGNTPPVATDSTNQTALVGTAFSYTVNTFTDTETPNSLTYNARIDPANGLNFNPTTRVIAGTPTTGGVSSVTITATDPGSLSASTTFTITSGTVCTGTPSPDYAALVDLYNATGGPNWTNKTNWLSGCSPCTWSGVTCNDYGRVKTISLPDNHLSGPIPASLSALTYLQFLDLRNNQLSGSIPASLSALTNLQTLFLSNNQLSGPIPASLGALPKLQFLALANNLLSGCFPASFSALCTVNYVDLSNNPGLPGGGNFNAFCYDGSGRCSPASVNTAPVATANTNQTATVGRAFSYTVNAFTDAQTPNALTYSARINLTNGLSFNPTTRVISGTPITSGISSVTITATDPGNLSASTTFGLLSNLATVTPGPTVPFAMTGVTAVNCQTVTTGQRRVTFNPQYAGLTNQPVSFWVINELSPTTSPGPYTLNLYTDNPIITLKAQQGNATASFAYNWLAACSGTVTPGPNTAPTVANVIPAQKATVGQGFRLAIPGGTFTDAQTPAQLSVSVGGLPIGLSFAGGVISGTPSVSSATTVTVTATDSGNLYVSTSFALTVSPAVTPNPVGSFTMTGVTTVSCQAVSAGQHRVTFSPQYAGLTNQPVSFGVTNEMVPTTNPGPYALNLYTDNPTITLNAQQGSATATFRYNWLAACNANGRLGAEPTPELTVLVLGNPVMGESVEVEVRGAAGQRLHLQTVNGQGRVISQTTLEQAGPVERRTLGLERPAGLYFLRVSTPTQRQVVKVIKP